MAARYWLLVISFVQRTTSLWLAWFIVIGSLFLTGTVNAQTYPISSPSANINQPANIFFSNQSPQYANIVVINLIHTFSCLAEGSSIIGQPCIEYQTETSGPNTGLMVPKQTFISSGGALGSIVTFITMMYNTPPLNAPQYVASTFQDMGITPAYAQVNGSGNNILSPILPLWKLARNLSYMAMIFIFLVIGFMIMFRQKINPQTVISAQSALPSLVVGLILITFSYFLASTVVDVTFVSVHVAGKVLEQGDIIKDGTTDSLLKNNNILSTYSSFIELKWPTEIVNTTTETVESLKKTGTLGGMMDNISVIGGCLLGTKISTIKNVSTTAFSAIGTAVGTAVGGPGVGSGIGAALGGGIGSLLGTGLSCAGGGLVGYIVKNSSLPGTLMGLVLYIILMISLLIALFKTLFALLTSYISILINTITAPFQFLIGSIPGKQNALSGWLKTMLGNLLVFPAVFGALLFAAYILGSDAPKAFNIIGNPSGNFNGTIPLLGGLSPVFLKVIFAYGVLLMIPAIPEAVKSAFGVKDNQLFGKNILGGFMGGVGVINKGWQQTGLPAQRKAYQELKARSIASGKPGEAPTPYAIPPGTKWYKKLGDRVLGTIVRH